MKRVSLVQMKVNQKGIVAEIQGGKAFENRCISLGIVQGREVIKLSQFIMRGPVAIKVGRAVLALGYGMAHKIIIETE
jgi:Fe2+ transport system protein FeoA